MSNPYTPFTKSQPKRDPKRGLTGSALNGSRGRSGDYDEIIYGDSGVLERVSRMRNLLSAMQLEVTPVQDETLSERTFRTNCERIFIDMKEARDNTSSSADMLRGLADAIVRGFSVWNLWFEEDVTTSTGYRLRYFKIHPSTISSWDFDHLGYPTGLVQTTPNGKLEISMDELALVTPWADEGPEGIAMLRPLLYLFEVKKQVLFELGRRSSTQAGLGVVTQNNQADNEAATQVIQAVDSLVNGEESALMLPNGYELDLLNLPTGMDLLPVVHYVDDKIAQLFDDVLSSLVSKVQGSRALGEVVAAESDWSSSIQLESLILSFSRALFGFVANNQGYTGRIPTLSPSVADMIGSKDSLDRAVIVNSLVGLREADEEQLRKHAGLAPLQDAGAKIEVLSPSPLFQATDTHHQEYECCGGGSHIHYADEVPEGYDADIEWSRLRREREEAEDKLYKDSIRLANQLRQAFAEGTASQDTWIPRISDVFFEYFTGRRLATAQMAQLEAQRQQRAGRVQDIPSDVDEWMTLGMIAGNALSSLVSRYSSRLAAQADLNAWDFYRKIEQEYREVQVFGRQDLPTPIDGKALSQGARHSGRIAEQVGRFEAASASTGELVPIRLIRSGFDDANRCNHCEQAKGTVVDLLTTPVEDIPILPDPRCEGTASRCRCGWLLIYGRKTSI